MSPTRRWPLLLALLPLLLGLAVYGYLWRGWAAGFDETLVRWFPGKTPAVTGFPYRLEAELAGVMLAHEGEVTLGLTADRLRLNRGPWRPELTVAQGQGVTLRAERGGLRSAVKAAAATASLRLGQGRLERLSIILPQVQGSFGIGPDFAAETLELHARERAEPAPADGDARLPVQGQLVLTAAGLRLGQGAALQLDGDALVRSPQRLAAYSRWAQGGSVDLTLAGRDATGELFRLEASIVDVQGRLQLAGTITTVCPLAVSAALAGAAAPAELRLRAPVRLAVESALPAGGPVALSGLPADLAGRSRRGQLPACPRLR